MQENNESKHITLSTVEEYEEKKAKIQAYHDATVAHIREFGNGIPCEVAAKFPFATEVSNELRSAVEEFQWRHEPPDKYFLYIDETKKEAITWTGQRLGSVFFGKTYYYGGSKRVAITVQGSNGRKYHGTYFKGAGNYARIKLFKNQ
jgi:hypothetical protein